jgi:hypothetical protein
MFKSIEKSVVEKMAFRNFPCLRKSWSFGTLRYFYAENAKYIFRIFSGVLYVIIIMIISPVICYFEGKG